MTGPQPEATTKYNEESFTKVRFKPRPMALYPGFCSGPCCHHQIYRVPDGTRSVKKIKLGKDIKRELQEALALTHRRRGGPP